MSRTTELKKDIYNLLVKTEKPVFYFQASSTESYPYIVFSISNITDFKVLTVDAWSNSEDSNEVEVLFDEIEDILNGEFFCNDNHFVCIDSNEDRKRLEDEDKSIKRIQETFQIFYKGVDSEI